MTKGTVKSLRELAVVIRSKNAGAFGLTLDILFKDRKSYEHAVKAGVITAERIAHLYRIPVGDVRKVVPLEMFNGYKITIRRPIPCGSLGDADVYGAQQHAPLYLIEIPCGEEQCTGGK